MNNKLYFWLAGLLVAAALFAGLAVSGHKTSPPGPSSVAAATTNQVTIKNYMFNPTVIKVKVGTTVTWTNQDAVNHTITADTLSSSAPSSMDVADGKSYKFTFNKTGTYSYHCFPHPYMHGTVEVTQ